MNMLFYLRHSLGFFLQIFPCAVLCYLPFQKDYYRFSRRITLAIVFVIGVLSAILFPITQNKKSEELFGSINASANVYMLVIIVIVVMFFYFTIEERAIKKMIVLNLVVFYASTQYMIVNLFAPLITSNDLMEVYSTAYFVLFFVSTVVLFPMTGLMMRKVVYQYMQEIDPDNMQREFRWAVSISVFSIIMMCIYATVPITKEFNEWSATGPLFILITIVLIQLFYSLFEESVVRKREEEKKRQLEISNVQYHNISNEIEKMKRVRHDMRHHLRTIHDMAGNNRTEEIKTYIETLVEISGEYSSREYCGNMVINGLLQYYDGIAKSYGIESSINAKCEEVFIADTDLTVLIGNSMENAINACRKAEKHLEKSKIYVDIGVIGSALMIQIKNSCTGVHPSGKYKLGNDFVPAAAFLSNNKKGGIGLRSIENTVERYSGEALFKYDENHRVFTTRIRINFYPDIL